MSRQAAALYGELSSAPVAPTVCERIYTLLQCIYDNNDHNSYENDIVTLANELMAVTKTYDILFFHLYDSLMNLNYGSALQIGNLLLQHEAMLHNIASQRNIVRPSVLN